jgi:hypothetical protein
VTARVISGRVAPAITADHVRNACGLAMFVAAGMHVAVALGHPASNFGMSSLAAGVAQGTLGSIVLTSRSRTVLYAVMLLNLMLILMYVVNVVVGLPPAIAHTHVSGTRHLWGVTLAMPGPFEWQGVFAKATELIGAVSAAACARASRRDG